MDFLKTILTRFMTTTDGVTTLAIPAEELRRFFEEHLTHEKQAPVIIGKMWLQAKEQGDYRLTVRKPLCVLYEKNGFRGIHNFTRAKVVHALRKAGLSNIPSSAAVRADHGETEENEFRISGILVTWTEQPETNSTQILDRIQRRDAFDCEGSVQLATLVLYPEDLDQVLGTYLQCSYISKVKYEPEENRLRVSFRQAGDTELSTRTVSTTVFIQTLRGLFNTDLVPTYAVAKAFYPGDDKPVLHLYWVE
jgi:hypothetical protein